MIGVWCKLRVCYLLVVALLFGGGKLKTVCLLCCLVPADSALFHCGCSCYCLCALNGGYCSVLVGVLKLIRNERKVCLFFCSRNESFLLLFGFCYSSTATDGLSQMSRRAVPA